MGNFRGKIEEWNKYNLSLASIRSSYAYHDHIKVAHYSFHDFHSWYFHLSSNNKFLAEYARRKKSTYRSWRRYWDSKSLRRKGFRSSVYWIALFKGKPTSKNRVISFNHSFKLKIIQMAWSWLDLRWISKNIDINM